MANSKAQANQTRIGVYGESSSFIPIRDDLRRSAAFLSLTCTSQMVLIDFMWHYLRRSNFDRSREDFTRPILYTYGMCAITIGRTTFYRCMRQLQAKRFVTPHTAHQRRAGQAQRWRISGGWKAWKPGEAELRVLNDYNNRRCQSIEDPNQMTIPFVARLALLNTPTPEETDEPESISDIYVRAAKENDLAGGRNAMLL